jgi:hypothetical protein
MAPIWWLPYRARSKESLTTETIYLPCVKRTTPGVDVKASLARLMAYKTSIDAINGPAISDKKGRSYSTKDMTDSFQEFWRICLTQRGISSHQILHQRRYYMRNIKPFVRSEGHLTQERLRWKSVPRTSISSINGSRSKRHRAGELWCQWDSITCSSTYA